MCNEESNRTPCMQHTHTCIRICSQHVCTDIIIMIQQKKNRIIPSVLHYNHFNWVTDDSVNAQCAQQKTRIVKLTYKGFHGTNKGYKRHKSVMCCNLCFDQCLKCASTQQTGYNNCPMQDFTRMNLIFLKYQ